MYSPGRMTRWEPTDEVGLPVSTATEVAWSFPDTTRSAGK